ncbi:phosphate permease [Ectothiorhodospira sp. PHS-1]|uniref:inorganic phosphate transporter n=1 Tax=Ectothiorhodospira sp. PHS-1 TaxID=519989 RepID=UPI00024A87DB|nr:inorganic phosphate transporter [Ectothiorhodospira sp. PHS-1]EHQ53559.1 phosphate permease [Ectothiorhodospira sp. PHS-1]
MANTSSPNGTGDGDLQPPLVSGQDGSKHAGESGLGRSISFGIAILFLIGVAVYAKLTLGEAAGAGFVVFAAIIGAYMAMNIGANDVANNVGPAVGSGAITLLGALAIAGVFEAMGAIIAGGEVVNTIRSGIIDPEMIANPDTFLWVMMAALLAAAIWINIATAMGAPVSTTHSIVGAVAGAGIAAAGFAIANWDVIGRIVMSWVISPMMGAGIAAFLLYVIKRTITYQSDLNAAAMRWVPVLVAFMGGVFGVYMMLKGFSRIMKVDLHTAVIVGMVAALLTYALVKALLTRIGEVENSKTGVNRLFNIPLIFAAAMLSFAHGSNDVANAIGPLAAIVEVTRSGGAEITQAAPIPLWVLVIGALGLAVGLWLFGARVIRTIGSEITEMDQMRAYCIAMSATITVLIASELGLPVSTTHVAVGAVMGVGFLREYLKTNYDNILAEIREHHAGEERESLDRFMRKFKAADIRERGIMLKALKAKNRARAETTIISKRERKRIRKLYRKELVKRSLVIRIVAAWVITVPSTALIAAFLFFTIRGYML